MISIILMSILILLFEISFREVILFQNLSLFFILINILYWSKRYRLAIVIGFIVGFFIDLFLQSHFGETLFSVFLPLLVLTFFDSLLRIEGSLNRTIFSSIGTAFAIFLREILFELVFWEGDFEPSAVMRTVVVSIVFVLIINIFFSKYLLADKKEGAFL